MRKSSVAETLREKNMEVTGSKGAGEERGEKQKGTRSRKEDKQEASGLEGGVAVLGGEDARKPYCATCRRKYRTFLSSLF